MAECAKPKFVVPEPVEGRCPHCAAETLARYEVLSEGGWFKVLKCRRCLVSLERTPWARYGYLERDAYAALNNAPADGR